MKFRPSLLLLPSFLSVTLLSCTALAGETQTVDVDYKYTQDHGVDFSETTGALKIGEFEDARQVEEPRQVTEANGGYKTSEPVADILQEALVQAFEKGGAKLVDSEEELLLRGSLTDLQVEEANGSVAVTLRARADLKRSGRTLWEEDLFGRANASDYDSLDEAIGKALDQLIEGLVWDDYFLMHVI